MNIESIIYLILSGSLLALLLSKKVMNNNLWRAIMTPLASIIGSGFLIAAPLLNSLSGGAAPYLMLALCLTSYGVGEVIRWNIVAVEPIVEGDDSKNSHYLKLNEQMGEWVLSFAYILSITYYLYLFSSFFLRLAGETDPLLEKSVVTLVLSSVAYFGHQHGLSSLEKLESLSVSLKLSIIITFLVGLGVYLFDHEYKMGSLPEGAFSYDNIAVCLGLLIMVQGFETSRYLSEEYDGPTRVKSMRYAQIGSSIIYMLLIVLFIPVFEAHPMTGEITETSVIDIGKYVFKLAPMFLFAAAMASQLSAAVADMSGGGGLFSELSKGKIKSKNAYLLIAGLGIALVWCFDIFNIISLASKGFALYYFFQMLSSVIMNYKKNHMKFIFSILMAIVCLSIVVLGKSFE